MKLKQAKAPSVATKEQREMLIIAQNVSLPDTLKEDDELLVGASSLSGRYWFGSLHYYGSVGGAVNNEKYSAAVQLQSGLSDALWVDACHVLVGLDTGGIDLWALEDEKTSFSLVSSALEHDDMTSSVSTNSDKSNFLSASYDHTLKLWNHELKSLHSFEAHSGIVWDVQCHPTDPHLFLSCSQDGNVLLWDIRAWDKPASNVGNTASGHLPTCMTWNPAARNLYAIGDQGGHISVQDLRWMVEKTVSFQPHTRQVSSLLYCPDRPNLLASVSEDCTAILSSVNSSSLSPRQLLVIAAHRDFVRGLTWANDSQLVTCGWDGQILQNDTKTVAGLKSAMVNGHDDCNLKVDNDVGTED